jgi:hypothetical protein
LGAAEELSRSGGFCWDDLIPVAAEEGVLPALAGQSRGWELAPAEHAALFENVESANRERNAEIRTELEHTVRLLNAAGIAPVLLKGAAYFACGVYEDPAERYLLDLDLLVSEEEYGKAVSALREGGYIAEDRDPFGMFKHHYPALARPGRAAVEIHRSIGYSQCEKLLPAREILAGSLPCGRDGLQMRVPSPEHLAIHLIAHSQLQHPYNERISPPLRALRDLALLHRRFGAEIGWERVKARFAARGYSRLLALHLMQAEIELRPGLPVEMRVDAATRFLWWRRRAIQKRPGLRYFDPAFMYGTVLARRLRVMRRMLGTRDGVRQLMGQVFSPAGYARLWADLIGGRGR